VHLALTPECWCRGTFT